MSEDGSTPSSASDSGRHRIVCVVLLVLIVLVAIAIVVLGVSGGAREATPARGSAGPLMETTPAGEPAQPTKR